MRSRRFLAVLRKEVLHILRDPRTLGISLFLPLFQLLMYSFVLTFDVNHIPTVVADFDRTPASREFLSAYGASTYFDLIPVHTHAEVDDALTKGSAKAAIVVPPGFGRTLLAGGRAQLQVLVDGSDPRVAAVAQGYAQAIATQHGSTLRSRALAAKGIMMTRGLPPIRAERRVWYNPELESLDYIVPGLIAVIMASLTAVQIAGAVVVEREQRTLENLVISPLRSSELIAGKVSPYIVLAGLQAGTISAVAVFGLGVPFRGSVAIFAVALVLYVATMLGLGLAVSAVARTQQAAMFLSFMVSMLPSFMLSGFIFPIASMPRAIQYVTYLVPPRYFLSVVRGVFLKGAPLDALAGDIAALAAFAAVGLIVSTVLLRRRLD